MSLSLQVVTNPRKIAVNYVKSWFVIDTLAAVPFDLLFFGTGTSDVSIAIAPDSQSSVVLNPSESKGNYSSTSNSIKLVHWPLMGGLLHLVQRGGA